MANVEKLPVICTSQTTDQIKTDEEVVKKAKIRKRKKGKKVDFTQTRTD